MEEKPKLGRFLSNYYNPALPDAKEHFHFTTYADSAQEEEWQKHLDKINAGIIGPPKATKNYGVQQLKDDGLIGVYAHPD